MSRQLTDNDSKLLFNAFAANGLFSLSCGLAMTVFAGPVASLLGVSGPGWILGLGIVLILFGGSLLVHFRRKRVSQVEAWMISAMDLGWVLASAVLVLLAPEFLSREGLIAVVLVGVVVLAFFELQALALWRIAH